MADWNELLKSVDLEAIAQDPIQSVFTPQEWLILSPIAYFVYSPCFFW
jgi:hypothetical protein